MCGIAGFLEPNGFDQARASATVVAMQGALRHRGPDDAGKWLDREAGVALGFVRLAIIDLSPAGAQPMISRSGRYAFTFNGEIYNHLELRARLEESGQAPEWDGHSDSETLLACIDAWGFATALKAASGMFAIAVWDKAEQTLLLARDRMGEKPLFYGWQRRDGREAFLYGSELKALRCHPAFEGQVDRDSLAQFMRYGYVLAPRSIYCGIAKLPPGAFARVGLRRREIAIKQYWSASETAAAGLRDPLDVTPREATDALGALLGRAVTRQMLADVPLGGFLSGGIDSSTVVSLMQANSARPVQTFTIGFDEDGFNEAGHAARVARHLGTEHHELLVSAADALAVIPRLPAIYDEPFADNSQIPTFLVAQMARRNVTVALSGDGGDELFAGYDRYALADRLWRQVGWAPRGIRHPLGRAVQALPKSWLNRMGGGRGFSTLGDTVHRAGGALGARSASGIGVEISGRWPAAGVVVGGAEPPSAYTHPPALGGTPIEDMMALDMETYLPDDILAKVDRAAMAVSLETRVPFLDHEVVEFAWRLPLSLKRRDGVTKWIVRQLLDRHVPRAIIDRPKMGFAMPVDAWLRGPLREWAEALFDERRLRDEGFLRPAPIRRAWRMHLSGAANLRGPLWSALMFQAWWSALDDS